MWKRRPHETETPVPQQPQRGHPGRLLTKGGASPPTLTAAHDAACWTTCPMCQAGATPTAGATSSPRSTACVNHNLPVSIRRLTNEEGRFVPAGTAQDAGAGPGGPPPAALGDYGDAAILPDHSATPPPRRALTPDSPEGSPKRRRHGEDGHDALLVGAARAAEVRLDGLPAHELPLANRAMATERESYKEFRAIAEITAAELGRLLARQPRPRIIDTRWVVTRKGSGFKARLVGQEPKGAARTDSPTGSHLALMENIERVLLLRLPHAHPPPGCHPFQVVVAVWAIYGTRDAGRAFYAHARGVLQAHGFEESRLEEAFYVLREKNRPRRPAHSRRRLPPRDRRLRVCTRMYARVLSIKGQLRMKQHPAEGFTYRGITLSMQPNQTGANQRKAAECLVQLGFLGDAQRP